MSHLAHRCALVTGGSSGIGRATCRRLAKDGASVVVNYGGDRAAAEEVVAGIEAEGGHAAAVKADVSDEQEVARLFDEGEDALGTQVNLLVNNAGIEAPFELVDMELAEWERVLAVNLRGPFLTSREMARRLIARSKTGTIVMNTSVHETIPWPRFSHYCASKGGLKLFTQTIARELAPKGIRVCSVAPGAIVTPINAGWLDDPKERARVERDIPLGRLGAPEEVAGVISWLASAEAEYLVGTTVFADGGMTLYPNEWSRTDPE
ncbi:MAG: SDR family oxidoreductase [Thermoleophilaceae bacterium]|nr:SDR family oxidoreductase [Thermoleophilaceae bacterium]